MAVDVPGGGDLRVADCAGLTNAMFYFGAPGTFIRPFSGGYGKGSASGRGGWNMECPHYEIARGLEFVSVGKGVELGVGGDVPVPADAVLDS